MAEEPNPLNAEDMEKAESDLERSIRDFLDAHPLFSQTNAPARKRMVSNGIKGVLTGLCLADFSKVKVSDT